MDWKQYLSDILRVPATHIVVRKPGDPTEEYQDDMQVAKNSEYKNKLLSLDYQDAPKVNAEEFHSTKANMSLLKELLKDREVNKDAPKEKENIMSKEEQSTQSPLSNVTKVHPIEGKK